jgi:hypothetical protein
MGAGRLVPVDRRLFRLACVRGGEVLMTPTDTVTAAERLAETLHRLGYLIDRHHLPAPVEMRVRRLSVGLDLADLHDLKRWAEAADAEVTKTRAYGEWRHMACGVIGDVPLRLSCFGKALTP